MKSVRGDDMSEIKAALETHITNAQCGQCEHLSWWGVRPYPFACQKRWIMLPAYVNPDFAQGCPHFKERWYVQRRAHP